MRPEYRFVVLNHWNWPSIGSIGQFEQFPTCQLQLNGGTQPKGNVKGAKPKGKASAKSILASISRKVL